MRLYLWWMTLVIRRWWREYLPRWVAFHIPPRIAYWCFIRVHARSEVHWTFAEVAKTWERENNLKDWWED